MEINRISEIISRISHFCTGFPAGPLCHFLQPNYKIIFTGKVIFDTLAQIC